MNRNSQIRSRFLRRVARIDFLAAACLECGELGRARRVEEGMEITEYERGMWDI